MWTYKGIDVHSASPNSYGIRWVAHMPWDSEPVHRADSKAMMRYLITQTLTAHGIIRFGR